MNIKVVLATSAYNSKLSSSNCSQLQAACCWSYCFTEALGDRAKQISQNSKNLTCKHGDNVKTGWLWWPTNAVSCQ